MNEFGYESITPAELNVIITDLDTNLKYLTDLKFNTSEIKTSLATINTDWNNLKADLFINGTLSMKPKNIHAVALYESCNSILEKANTTTKMYADLNKI